MILDGISIIANHPWHVMRNSRDRHTKHIDNQEPVKLRHSCIEKSMKKRFRQSPRMNGKAKPMSLCFGMCLSGSQLMLIGAICESNKKVNMITISKADLQKAK